MDWKSIEFDWQRFKGPARERWARLSEKQLDDTAGRRIALAICLQHTYFVSPAEADRQVAEWQGQQGEPK